jgi:hypothetical protein
MNEDAQNKSSLKDDEFESIGWAELYSSEQAAESKAM